MIPIIIMIISLLLDGLLTNFLPFMPNDLSYFTPLFTVVSIFIIYPYYRKNIKKYLITIFILGMIYDIFYTNLLFFNGVLFCLVGLLVKLLYKNFEVTPIRLLFYLVIIVSFYESLYGIILLVFQMVPVTINKIIYKISHTLLLNIIYGEVVFIIEKIIPRKYKKMSIN